MSASNSPYLLKERNPKLGRYNVPRVPPNDANFARKRLLVVACCVLLLAGAVAFIVCAIVESPSAFFGHLSAAGSDNTPPRSCHLAVVRTADTLVENVSIPILAEDADANTLIDSFEAMEVTATGGSKLSRNSLG
ncbi:hypothetical protein MTO96_005483 [Rhipicephalus appendiculatus]